MLRYTALHLSLDTTSLWALDAMRTLEACHALDAMAHATSLLCTWQACYAIVDSLRNQKTIQTPNSFCRSNTETCDSGFRNQHLRFRSQCLSIRKTKMIECKTKRGRFCSRPKTPVKTLWNNTLISCASQDLKPAVTWSTWLGNAPGMVCILFPLFTIGDPQNGWFMMGNPLINW